MKKLVLSTVFALGLGLAGATAVSAAPASPVPNDGAPAASLVTPAQVVIVGPRHRRHCRVVTVCRRTPYGRRCHQERVCRY